MILSYTLSDRSQPLFDRLYKIIYTDEALREGLGSRGPTAGMPTAPLARRRGDNRMEKVMNDQQFDELLAVLGRIADSLMEVELRLTMLAATYVKISDPKGWARAEKAAEDDDIEYDSQGLS